MESGTDQNRQKCMGKTHMHMLCVSSKMQSSMEESERRDAATIFI